MAEEHDDINLRESFNQILKDKKGIIYLVSPGNFIYFHKKNINNPEDVFIAVAEFLESNLRLEHDDIVEIMKFTHKKVHEREDKNKSVKPE